MGIVNATPDSFYDGGLHASPSALIDHGLRLIDEGADIIDVGGESTRPGATPVSEEEELRRVLPVVRALAPRITVSIDTMKPRVAMEAVAAGAKIINDVSASLVSVAAESGAKWIAMHMQGTPATMQNRPNYENVVSEVSRFLADKVRLAAALNVEVLIDPGIGFGKSQQHNIDLLRALPVLVSAGTPVVLGVSRKSVIGQLTGEKLDRLPGSVAAALWGLLSGVSIVRVHDVRATVEAVAVMSVLSEVKSPSV